MASSAREIAIEARENVYIESFYRKSYVYTEDVKISMLLFILF